MITTFYAVAWLLVCDGNGIAAIPMPSMELCQQELKNVPRGSYITNQSRCIAGQDTRTGETK